MEQSIVEYFSGHEGYKCGYCNSTDSCFSHGMWAHTMTPIDYQNLIDRGWRRSGKYCYKPTMHLTCCPLYTIRCDAKKFTLTRSQKKVLKKVHKFLASGEREKVHQAPSSANNSDHEMDVSDFPQEVDMLSLKRIKKVKTIKQSDIKTDSTVSDGDCIGDIQNESCDNPPPGPHTPSKSSHSSIPSIDPTSPLKSSNSNSRPQCRKAKEIRKERRLQKLLKLGMSAEAAAASFKKKKNEPKSIEDFLADPLPPEPAHKLELRLVPSSIENPLFYETFEESYSVYKKYQMTIHNDSPEKCSTKQYTRFLVNSPFQLRLVCSDLESEEFMTTYDESYNIYVKYQMVIHGDTEEECTSASFENFLVNAPFKSIDVSPARNVYGSFHQQYWLDDKLIAVGVIDILPYCISSVYFYYDPEYSFLSLGTYAALREIAFTRELNTKSQDLQYYYMGYYIHSCIKMRYKGQYVPSLLLCPETYSFQPIEKCKPKLDISKYYRLEDDPKKGDPDGVVKLKEVVILYDKTKMTYPSYKSLKKNATDESEVQEYAKFIGKKCYRRMLLFRDL